MSVYRRSPGAAPSDVVIIAASGDERRARWIAGLMVGVTLAASLVAVALVDAETRTPAAFLGALFTSVAGGLAIAVYLQLRPAFIRVASGVLSIEHMLSSKRFDVTELRGVSGEYREPSTVEHVMMRLTSSARAIPKPTLTLDVEGVLHDLVLVNFAQSPDVIARRLRRFLKRGPSSLAPTAKETARQQRRNATVTLHTGSLTSRVRRTRLVEAGPEGLRIGNDPKSLRLYPWSEVVAAHLVHDLHGGVVIELELTAGRVVRLAGDYGLQSDELALRLAPRVYGLSGARLRAAAD